MFDTVKNSLGSNWPQRTPTLNIEWGQIDPKGNRRVKVHFSLHHNSWINLFLMLQKPDLYCEGASDDTTYRRPTAFVRRECVRQQRKSFSTVLLSQSDLSLGGSDESSSSWPTAEGNHSLAGHSWRRRANYWLTPWFKRMELVWLHCKRHAGVTDHHTCYA